MKTPELAFSFPYYIGVQLAAVVAQPKSAPLMTERLWVRIPPGAGIFSLLYPISGASLIQIPQGGATLLIFQ